MNTTTDKYEAKAVEVLRSARVPLTPVRVRTLSEDIKGLAMDLGDDFEAASPSETWAELRSRIGGVNNLRSYSDCLCVGKD